MKKIKKLLASTLVAVMFLSVTPIGSLFLQSFSDGLTLSASAEECSGFCGDNKYIDPNDSNVSWTFDDETGKLEISGNGKMYNYPLSKYAAWSDYDTQIKEVVINEGVENIGDRAFGYEGAWSCENLTKIIIPESITHIGEGAFENCSSLQEIVIPDSVTHIGKNAFKNCTDLTKIIIPESIISIGENAFANTAFYNDPSNWENGVLYLDKYLIEADNSFGGTYNVKNGTKVIADSAFYEVDSSLFSVTIPGTVSHIGDSAFYGSSLKSIKILEGTKSIGSHAFKYTSELNTVVFPDSIEYVGVETFYGSEYVEDDLKWTEDSLYIGKCLMDVRGTIGNEYKVKGGTKVIAGSAFLNDAIADTSGLKRFVMTDSVITIGEEAFGSIPGEPVGEFSGGCCEALEEIVFSKNLKTIGAYAFVWCSNIKELIIPDSVVSIGDNAFRGCSSAEKLVIGSNLKTIGDRAFYECSSIKEAVLPESVEEIGSDLFAHCNELENVDIECEITVITDGMFFGCENLKHIDIPKTIAAIGNQAFRYCTAGLTLATTDKLNYIDWFAFNDSQNIVVFGDKGSYTESFCLTRKIRFVAYEDIVAIAVKSPPINEQYVGKPVDTSGLVFTATLNDASTVDFNAGYTVTPATLTKAGEQIVTIEFAGKTTSFTVNAIEIQTVKGKVNSVSVDDVSMNYMNVTTLNTLINADGDIKYTVEYLTSNPLVATVDSNGNVKATGTGNATITCTATDEYGNTVSDTCNVKVSYAWWQWIIVIVLFGWIWY